MNLGLETKSAGKSGEQRGVREERWRRQEAREGQDQYRFVWWKWCMEKDQKPGGLSDTNWEGKQPLAVTLENY